jgi:hypothetical protein
MLGPFSRPMAILAGYQQSIQTQTGKEEYQKK